MTDLIINKEEEQPKRTVTKEKLRSIMEAASALTALGDEDDTQEESTPSKAEGEQPHADDKTDNGDEGSDKSLKRYIPDHKKPDAALTFPEKVRTQRILRDCHGGKRSIGFFYQSTLPVETYWSPTC